MRLVSVIPGCKRIMGVSGGYENHIPAFSPEKRQRGFQLQGISAVSCGHSVQRKPV